MTFVVLKLIVVQPQDDEFGKIYRRLKEQNVVGRRRKDDDVAARLSLLLPVALERKVERFHRLGSAAESQYGRVAVDPIRLPKPYGVPARCI